MINNKTFNAANVAAIFELPNIFALNFHFLILFFPFWGYFGAKILKISPCLDKTR